MLKSLMHQASKWSRLLSFDGSGLISSFHMVLIFPWNVPDSNKYPSYHRVRRVWMVLWPDNLGVSRDRVVKRIHTRQTGKETDRGPQSQTKYQSQGE